MRLALATCLAGALLIACGSEPTAIIGTPNTAPSEEPHGTGVGALGSNSDGGAESIADASSDSKGQDASVETDAGTWAGTGDACDSGDSCSNVWKMCVGGYCVVDACANPNDDSACRAKGGTCVKESLTTWPGQSLLVCEIQR